MIRLSEEKMKEYFDYVRKNFYPRWDKERKWRVRKANVKNMKKTYARCDKKNKTILLEETWNATEDRCLYVMVHEMAHAETSLLHNERFSQRMSKAKERARELGRSGLVEIMEVERAGYPILNDKENCPGKPGKDYRSFPECKSCLCAVICRPVWESEKKEG